jgi:hypothetical protein
MRHTDEGTVRDSTKGVARGADLSVDLETSAKTGLRQLEIEIVAGLSLRLMIKGFQVLCVLPGILWWM